MTDDLIRREDAIKVIDRMKHRLVGNGLTYEFMRQMILEIPSIDIVRCRECKHREEYPCKVYHEDDWFCADGERREP